MQKLCRMYPAVCRQVFTSEVLKISINVCLLLFTVRHKKWQREQWLQRAGPAAVLFVQNRWRQVQIEFNSFLSAYCSVLHRHFKCVHKYQSVCITNMLRGIQHEKERNRLSAKLNFQRLSEKRIRKQHLMSLHQLSSFFFVRQREMLLEIQTVKATFIQKIIRVLLARNKVRHVQKMKARNEVSSPKLLTHNQFRFPQSTKLGLGLGLAFSPQSIYVLKIHRIIHGPLVCSRMASGSTKEEGKGGRSG
jgi:hypothetical protein